MTCVQLLLSISECFGSSYLMLIMLPLFLAATGDDTDLPHLSSKLSVPIRGMEYVFLYVKFESFAGCQKKWDCNWQWGSVFWMEARWQLPLHHSNIRFNRRTLWDCSEVAETSLQWTKVQNLSMWMRSFWHSVERLSTSVSMWHDYINIPKIGY